jgi:sucrose-6F-phosphate phosphohydrolase
VQKIQSKNATTPFLLASDLDGTLLGDEEDARHLRQFISRHQARVTLAYVTGRCRRSVLELIAAGQLPRPRFICSEVGTEILDLDDSENAIGQAYAAQVPSDWNLDEIYRLGTGAGIIRQEFDEGQPRFQAGFYWDTRPETLAAFRERLSRLDALYIQTSYETYLDVLPVSLGKGSAVCFLRQKLAYSSDQVVVAGDAGNDRQMFETEFRGIVPVNALDELKALARQPWHYHSPRPVARGVIDGLHHFGFLAPEDIPVGEKTS